MWINGQFSEAVAEAFVQLHDRGLLQRKMRPVHWSCHLQSTISDIEVGTPVGAGCLAVVTDVAACADGQVNMVAVDTPCDIHVPGHGPVRMGLIYHIAFPLVGEAGELVVATTRPETMPGDVAVAVHSSHPLAEAARRGATVRHPLTGACVPLVVDDVLVDPAKGTGAVKITPGKPLL